MRRTHLSTFSTLIHRSARFGATVTLIACSLAVSGAVLVYRQTSPQDGALAAAAVTSSTPASVEDGAEALDAARWTPEGGDLAAVFQPEFPPEATVEPERVETFAAVTQIPPASTRVAAAAVAPPAAATPVAEPPVVASHASVYDAVAAAFPEQPDRAYSVVLCESSGHAATNTGNGYYGLWQFDLPTWQSVGGTGLPSEASVEEQVRRARLLFESRGWSPWGCAP